MNAKIWGRWVSRLFQQNRRGRRPHPSGRRLGFETLEDRVTPATVSWDGGGFNNLWSNPANWNVGGADGLPQAGDDLVFGGLAPAGDRSTLNDFADLRVFNSITISANGYVLGATAPKTVFSGGIVVGSDLGTLSITSNLEFRAPAGTLQQTVTVNSGSNLVVSGVVDGRPDALEAQQTITKSGPGTLELTRDNSVYTGAVTLANSGGVLFISHHNALGAGSNTTVNVNSSLRLKNLAAPVTEQLILNGTGVAQDGALLNFAGNNTWLGTITLDSDASIGVAATTTLTVPALITDTGSGHSLTKELRGRLILNRVGGNTYRGQTIIDDGILTIRDPLSLGAGADATKPQNGTPQAAAIVNFNSTTGEAGTLQIEFTTLSAADPNAILRNPALPFDATTNPVIGFQVFNQLLTLNGPGFNPTNPTNTGAGSLGALHNLAGDNIWSGNVTLGSLPPSTGFVGIGVAANTNLIVSGAVDDPNRQPELRKVLPGRLIFNHDNAYDGGTRVEGGVLNVRDSGALGSGPVRVFSGAALELEVDQGIDGTPLRNHNRNLGFDSVTASGPGQEVVVPGTTGTFTLTFRGATTGALGAASPTLAAEIQAALNALPTIGGAGGSVTVTKSGTVYRVIFGGSLANADIPLMTAAPTGGAGTVVNAVYGLNVSNLIDGIEHVLFPPPLQFPVGGLEGTGVNNTGALRSVSGINVYSGDIQLAGLTDNTDGSIGVDPDLRPGHNSPNADYFAWDHSLTVTGEIMDWDPAILNQFDQVVFGFITNLTKFGGGHLILPDANTYSGKTDITAGWVTARHDNALGTKIGSQSPTNWDPTTVADGAALHLKPLPGQNLDVPNNLVLSGNGIDHPFDLIDEAGAVQNLGGNNALSGIIKLDGQAGVGVEQVEPPAPGEDPSELTLTGHTWNFGNTVGGIDKLGTRRLAIQSPGTYTGPVEVREGVILVQHDTALGGRAGTVSVHSGAALELGNSVTDQTGGVAFGRGIWGEKLVLNGPGNALFGDSPLTVLSDNGPAVVGPVNNPIVPTDNAWRGPISLGEDVVITVRPDSRLVIAGPIDDANNPSPGGSDITITGGGVVELTGTNTYRGTTFVNQGVLILGNGQALGGSGGNEFQTLTLTGAAANTTRFTLTFNGQTTAPILFTGVGATTAAAIQAALNALPNVGGPAVGGQILVAEAAPGVFAIAFGGTFKGFDQSLLAAAVTVGPGTAAVVENIAGAGATVVADGASLQLAGSFTVAGEPLLLHGQGGASLPNVPTQWFQVGPGPITDGQTPGAQNVTGRINTTVADPRNPNVMYTATSGGGVWKTIDGGKSWRPIFDAIPEIQHVLLTPGTTSFTLTFDGATTGVLNAGSPTLAADIQAALDALPTVGGLGGHVTVVEVGNGFEVTFHGELAGGDVPTIDGSAGVVVTTAQQGRNPRFAMYVGSILLEPGNPDTVYVGTGDPNSMTDTFYGTGVYVSNDAGLTWRIARGEETQTVRVIGLGTTFTLTYEGATTAPISNTATAAQVQAALNALPTIGGVGGSVSVTRSGISEVQRVRVIGGLAAADTYTLTFNGATTAALAFNANSAAVQTALNNLATIGGVGGAVTVGPQTGVPEVQQLTVNFTPGPAQTFQLTFGGNTTTPIPAGASAAQVQAALTALGSIGAGGVTVTGGGAGSPSTYQITFTGAQGIFDKALIGFIPSNAFISGTVSEVNRGGVEYDVTFRFALDTFDQPQMSVAGTGLTTGTVTELVKGGVEYAVTFQGSLASGDASLLVGTIPPGDPGTIEIDVDAGSNPFDGKAVSRLSYDPAEDTLYVSAGDRIAPRDEVQQILTSTPFISLSFTGPDETGTIITASTGTILVDPQIIEDALKALPNINGGVEVDDQLNVTFTRNMGNMNVAHLVPTPGYPTVRIRSVMEGGAADVNGTPGGPGVIRLRAALAEQRVTVLQTQGTFTLSFGGFTTAPLPFDVTAANMQAALNALPSVIAIGGVRSVFQSNNVYVVTFNSTIPQALMTAVGQVQISAIARGGEFGWYNMTSVVSTNRSLVATTQAVPGTQGANPIGSTSGSALIPNTPGPDDDYRLRFPQVGANWTDVIAGGTVFAALGTPAGPGPGPIAFGGSGFATGTLINNAVYWTSNPYSRIPIWNVGDTAGTPDARNAGFPRGTFNVPNPGPGLPPILEVPLNGNIRIARSGGIVFALTSTPEGRLRELYRSLDGGRTWETATNPGNMLYSVGNFSNAVIAFPTPDDVLPPRTSVVIAGQGTGPGGAQTILMSPDSGTTWVNLSTVGNGGPHAGVHGITRDRNGNLLVSTDGGLWRYEFTPTLTDAATTGSWVNLNGDLQIALMNGVAGTPVGTSVIYGGSQHNGIDKFTNSLTWERLEAYGGGRVAVDPNNSQTVYAVSMLAGTSAVLRKSTNGGNTWTTVLQFHNPTAPLVVDPVNSNRVLVGGARLFESLDGGASWTDLLTPEELAVTDVAPANAQGPFVLDPAFLQVTDKGANAYDPDTIYVTDGDTIHLTKNHAQLWVNTTTNLAGLGSISDLEVDPRNRDTVYVARAAFGGEQIFRTTDAGQTWEDITNDLPDLPVWKIIVDPRTGYLYAGTDEGVFHSTDGGASWERFGVGMPNVQVKDMELNLTTNTLLAGTYGRSVFQLFLDSRQSANAPVNAAVVALSGSSVWAGPVILSGTPGPNTVTVGAYGAPNLPNTIPAASLNFVGQISDLTAGGNPTLKKIGLGDVILSGANVYGGATVVQEGALVVDNAHALGLNANGTTVVDGAVLELRSSLDAEPVFLNGNGQSFDDHYTGALRNVAGDNTYVGPLTLSTNTTIGVDSGSTLTIGTSPQLAGTGTILGANSLTKELTGTLVLASDNPGFSGATFVNRGALRVQHAGALGTGAAATRVLDGAQIQLQSPAGGPGLVVNRPLAVSGTGIFGTGAIRNTGGDNTWAGSITLDTLPGFGPDTFPVGFVSIAVDNPDDTLTVTGPISETAPTGLTKIGPGELMLAAANTYSGATEVLEGTLTVGHSNALGLRSGTASVQRVVTLSSAQSGEFRLSFNGVLSAPINFGASAATVQAVLNGLSSIGGAGGSVTVTRTTVQTTTQDGPGAPGFLYTVVFGGSLANTTIPLTAAGQNGTGATASVVATGGIDTRVFNGATLELDSTLAPTPAGFTVSGRRVTASGQGIGGHGAIRNTVGDNTWDGPVAFTADTWVGADAASSLTLSGGVAAAGLNLRKVDGGTLVFPADPDANTQALTVAADGNVQVDGTVGDVRLAGGTVSGTGSVGVITTTGGGAVNPGDNYPAPGTGTLNAVAAALNGTNQFVVNLNNSAVPTNDRLNLIGNINLGGATLAGTVTNVAIGDSFTIIQTAGAVSGQFAGASTTPVAGGTSATVAYIGPIKFIVDYFPDHVVLTRALADTTVDLAAAPARGTKIRAFTFTAQVAAAPPGSGLPTGTVTFTDTTSGRVLGTVPVDGTGRATLYTALSDPNAPQLALGGHVIQAAYSGDGNFAQASDTVGVTVIANGTRSSRTVLRSSANPWIEDSPVTFTVTVRDAGALPTRTPGGSVEFYDLTTGQVLGYANLAAVRPGVTRATFTTAFADPGTHQVRARYSGNALFARSVAVLDQVIVSEPARTSSITVTEPAGQADPSPFGQALTFTATVTDDLNALAPTGTVTFVDTTTNSVLGVVALTTTGVGQAQATLTTSALAVGAHSVVAQYNGSLEFAIGAASAPATQTVVPAATAMVLTSTADPSKFGQTVTFRAQLSSDSGAVPTGQVVFKNGTEVLGSAFVDAAGLATFTTNALAVGAHAITAEYAGGPNFTASNTGALTQDVEASATRAVVTRSTTDPRVRLVLTARIAAVAPGTAKIAKPTGEATFLIDGVSRGTVTLVNGVAKLVLPSGLSAGRHRIVVQYAGDGNFLASTTTVFFDFGSR